MRSRLLLVCLLSGLVVLPVRAGDWPAWRHDAQRTNCTPDPLPDGLQLHWHRTLPRLDTAWDDQPMMIFDAGYEPVVQGQWLYLASSRTDSVTAYDTRSGAQKWRFFAEGPVRFAPVVGGELLYFCSDDGYLYALDALQGTLRWKVRGGPDDRKVLGNERLTSMWPARGAPVLHRGRVSFAAGIWPFMGIFLHTVDARTGKVLWTNDGDGSIYIKQPHSADSFAGVAPQGPLSAIGSRVLVPGGRSVPACYDLDTGKLLHFLLNDNSKRGGGPVAATGEKYFVNGDALFELERGTYQGVVGSLPVVDGQSLTTAGKSGVTTYRWNETSSGRLKSNVPVQGTLAVTDATAMVQAGTRLYVGSKNQVRAFALPLPAESDGSPAAPAWQQTIEGTPFSLVAADDRLWVSTLEGRIYCFGPGPRNLQVHAEPEVPPGTPGELPADMPREGYAVFLGFDGEELNRLVRGTKLEIVGVDPRPEVILNARQAFCRNSAHGERISFLECDAERLALPPYLATLLVVQDASTLADATLRRLYESVRPYGGRLSLRVPAAGRAALLARVQGLGLANAVCGESNSGVEVVREGALPGAADWTHEHADASNCRVSRDQRVKAPLGILWFGGPPNDGILPRHGHGPQPQVVEGRLIIEGVDKLRAIDIYTGRLLWEASLPGVGALYDNLAHQAGANATSSNYISHREGIYVAYRGACVVLNPATGRQVRTFQLPTPEGKSMPPRWGYLNVAGDYLIGGTDPSAEAPPLDGKPAPASIKFPRLGDGEAIASSKELLVMDRKSGKLLWKVTARFGYRNNAVCIGGGKLYAIDRLPGSQLLKLRKEGKLPADPAIITAWDLKTGKEIWSEDEEIFGTWLSYSERYDVLVESGRVARDTLSDEPKGMRAYRAASGVVMWTEKTYVGPAMLHGDTVFKDTTACDLLTGEARVRPDPLTGAPTPWSFSRNYGCNTPLAAEHLLTFRSGAAGYCDLLNDSGTGNFGGFRSSCTNNLIVGGGIITAPDYTRTCTCSYQNQCSIALVPMPDAEMWTSYGKADLKAPVLRVGVNFGAPGDRKSDEGTLWLESPSVGGSSPSLEVHVAGGQVSYFRRHSAGFRGALPWVVASGVEGAEAITVTLGPKATPEREYRVRLFFAEPEELGEGERLQDITLQGKRVLSQFDAVREAGGARRGVSREFVTTAGGELVVQLQPSDNSRRKRTMLCGIELIHQPK